MLEKMVAGTFTMIMLLLITVACVWFAENFPWAVILIIVSIVGLLVYYFKGS